MPQVRTYTQQVTTERAPTVSRPEQRIGQLQTPPPQVPATGGAEGAARFGQNAMGIGSELYAAETHRQNQIRLLDADRQAGQLENQLMYDPNSGALNVKGKDSFALPDTVGRTWDSETGKIRQGLGNDRQRLAFDEYNVRKRQSMMDTLDRHIAQESYRVDSEALEGKVENETTAALADPRPENINPRLNNVRQAYADYGE